MCSNVKTSCIIETVSITGIPITRTFNLQFPELPSVGDQIELYDGNYSVVRRVWKKDMTLTLHLSPINHSIDVSIMAE